MSQSAQSWNHTRDQYNNCRAGLAGVVASADSPGQIRAARNLSNNLCACIVNNIAAIWDAYGCEEMPTLMRLARNNGADIDKISSQCRSKYVTPYISSATSSRDSGPRPSPSASVAASASGAAPKINNKYPVDCGLQPTKSLFVRCMQNL